MNLLATESLLQAVSADQPAGQDLEYDPDFRALMEAATGTPERIMGTTVIPAEEPDWRRVLEAGTALLGRSKDLRVAVLVTRALLGLKGLPGLHAGLDLIHRLIVQYWDGLYPALDPDDDNDPTARVNVLLELTDRDTILAQLRTTPLIRSRVFGPISCRDMEIAEGRAPALAGSKSLDAAAVAAAFQDCDLETLVDAVAAVSGALATLKAVGDELDARIARSQLPSFDPLAEPLKQVQTMLQGPLRSRQPDAADPGTSDGDAAAPGTAATAGPTAAAGGPPGQIASRDDVTRALERICDYYSRCEPSSPVPLILKRAQRLVKGNFVDILRDLAPDAMPELAKVFGLENES